MTIDTRIQNGDVTDDIDSLFDRATVDRLLTTTRAVRRRLDLDRPVEPEVIEECIDLAVQAPAASNQQNWRWLVVTDEEKRRTIANLCRVAWGYYAAGSGNQRRRASRQGSSAAPARIMESAQWLADHLHEVPVHVIVCQAGRVRSSSRRVASVAQTWEKVQQIVAPDMADGYAEKAITQATLLREVMFFGSIFPAVWSFQLALRSRGLGSVITATHLPIEDQISEVVGIPSRVTQVALLPVAYTLGNDFRRAPRTPANELTYWNEWGETRPKTEDLVLSSDRTGQAP